MSSDTIAAIATPPGSGGVAIVRMSGPGALDLAQARFRHLNGRELDPPLGRRHGREVDVGHLVDASGQVLDEVVMLVFRAPQSYTTEDVVEFQVHAGPAMGQRILRMCLEGGARLATAGEFTRRAFLGGRLDLTQAEAIADLTGARTDRALSAAVAQLEGKLARAVREGREGIMQLLGALEAAIDFPDEVDPPAGLETRLAELEARTEALLATAGEGRLLREGATLVLLGRPNVGKSSLLNALLKEDRAIVTEIAGTTRDVLEAALALEGVPFRVLDTAGIHQGEMDRVEALGIARSHQALERADVRVVVVEAEGMTVADEALWLQARAAGPSVLVANKIDRVATLAAACQQAGAVAVSAATGAGLAELEQAIYNMASGAALAPVATASINARHQAALIRARQALIRARQACQAGLAADFLTMDLREALEVLGSITGEELIEEVIDHIFEQFCVGK